MSVRRFSNKKEGFSGGSQTYKEIYQQPEIWEETLNKFIEESATVRSFLKKALFEVDSIVLTGAGTSCFIGYSLSGILFKDMKKPCFTVATTDIVTFPEHYFDKGFSYLVVSFARSGRSPESIAALELADKYSKKCYHLIITCDSTGDLAQYSSQNPVLVFAQPDSTNDKGLAMTGSYSSMLLSGLMSGMIFENNVEEIKRQVALSMRLSQKNLDEKWELLNDIAGKEFHRAIFLGSGELYGTATEAALKLQELTGGRIVCKSDTFLGFRHGPKAVVNKDTLMVYFFNESAYVLQYEKDLVRSMDEGFPPLFQLGVGNKRLDLDQLDQQIIISDSEVELLPGFQALNYIIPAQLLAYFKSVQLGLKPDTPSENGAISRVVKGVHIYPDKN